MKRSILTTVAICTLQLIAFSQKPWIGFQSGFGFCNMVVTDDYGKSPSQMSMGFTTGVLIDWSLSDRFSIQPGVNFIQKGGVRKNNIAYGAEKQETVLNYLEVPANIIFYSKPMKRGVFAGAGLNLGIGLSGFKEAPDPYYSGWLGVNVEDINFGNAEDDHLKTFELGTNLLVGYSFKRGLFLSATGNFGLTNINNQNDSKIKNNYFALKVGWLIRRAS